ncbi:MAG: DNA mismatch repair endonuclease MutL [bacterium]
MGLIRQLDEITINQIAAGEVIDRPASVVKELVENSLDAGATKVDVFVEDGGREGIVIRDNGSGIAKEDFSSAFVRHATSKIRSLDDLYQVGSFGFRGEALASVSHVASVELRSAQTKGKGWQMTAYKGDFSSLKAVTMDKGTEMVVSTLFSDLAVRRRFLKSAGTELSHICEVITRFSLCYPAVDFVLKQGDKTLVNTCGILDQEALLLLHFGDDLRGKLARVDEVLPGLTVKGFVGTPQLTFSSRQKMIVTVNGRLIQSPLIFKSIQQCYQAVIPARRFPLVLLDLEVSTEGVDVNIHPQKQDVKFLAPGFLYDALPKAIQLSLQKVSQVQIESPVLSAVDMSEKSAAEVLTLSSSDQESMPVSMLSFSDSGEVSSSGPSQLSSFSVPRPQKPLEQVGLLHDTSSLRALDSPDYFQIFEGYLVLKTADALFILDQHAVHERILYESFQKEASSVTERQVLLIADIVEVDAGLLSVFEQHQSLFDQLNFVVEVFGPGQLAVREVPLVFASVSAAVIVRVLLESLKDAEGQPDLSFELKPWLQLKACKAAIKVGKRLSDAETKQLLKDFVACPSNFTCPHGRPLYIRYDKKAMERLFMRL